MGGTLKVPQSSTKIFEFWSRIRKVINPERWKKKKLPVNFPKLHSSLITRLHYTLFTYPNSGRACNGLACKGSCLRRAGPNSAWAGPKKPVPKRPGQRLSRAEFGPSLGNDPGRLEQKRPHKARVARPEGQHFLQKIQKNLTHIILQKKNIIISHLEHIL